MKHKTIPALLLIAYGAVLIKVMVFKDVPLIRIGELMVNFGGSQTGPANLIPFKTILVYLFGDKGLMIAGINLVGNIILLLPVGFLLPMLFRNLNWKKVMVIGAGAGLAIEGLQVILRVGIFDIDDVILNGLGVMAGYGVFNLRRSYVVAAAVLLGAFALYFAVQAPISFGPAVLHIQPKKPVAGKDGRLQYPDPCGGTGGTGKIIHIAKQTITLESREGHKELIRLNGQTKISNSMGMLSISQLKTGNRVTIVTFESDDSGHKIADVVLVCNATD